MDGRLPRTVVLELDWDNEKENGNYYIILGLGQRGRLDLQGTLSYPCSGPKGNFRV